MSPLSCNTHVVVEPYNSLYAFDVVPFIGTKSTVFVIAPFPKKIPLPLHFTTKVEFTMQSFAKPGIMSIAGSEFMIVGLVIIVLTLSTISLLLF